MKKIFLIILCSNIPIMLSTITQAQWKPVDLPDANFIIGFDNHLYSISNYGFYFSTKHDSTYTTDSSFVNAGIFSYALSAQNIYLGTWQGIFLSTNNGATWTSVDSNLWGGRFLLYAGSGNDIYLTPGLGLYLSINNGTSWTATADSGLTNTDIFAFASLNNTIFVGTNGGGIFRSTNKGNSWTPADSGISFWAGGFVCALGAKDTNLYCATWAGSLIEGTVPVWVYRSTDNGNSWSFASKGIQGDGSSSFVFAGNNIFLSTNTAANEHRLFVSTNEGTTWNQVDFDHGTILSFAVCDSDFIVSTEDGVWSRPLTQVLTTVHQNNHQSPAVFSLAQNYPNPFNPSTLITFSIPTKSYVSLTVYDVLGRKVRTLLTETLETGTHEVMFDASNCTSGIYFYRIENGSFSQTRKCLLLK